MKKGFTLVEITIVVTIIVILVAVSLPNLLRSRMGANEHDAISNLQTISVASQTFWSVGNASTSLPVNLSQLGSQRYISDDTLACPNAFCVKNGYRYYMGGTGKQDDFFVYAIPESANLTGIRSFCAGSDGVMRMNPNGATPASQNACTAWNPL